MISNTTLSSRGSCALLILVLVVVANTHSARALSSLPSATASPITLGDKYVVSIHTEKKQTPPASTHTVINMTKRSGQRYSCTIPHTKERQAKLPDPALALRQPEDLLKPLTGACFHRHEGWWTYELCYQKSVRQFHAEGTFPHPSNPKQKMHKIVVEYTLGLYDPVLTAAARGIPPTEGQPQESIQHFSGGTECDITGKQRSLEVHFKCNPDETTGHHIASIHEPATCHYVVQFVTPLLCPLPAFQAKTDPVVAITCSPLDEPSPPNSSPTTTTATSPATTPTAATSTPSEVDEPSLEVRESNPYEEL
eukprot:gnl/Spiro4/10329_TR5512_c0_g1_i1.p1 gnl/Spiro4/10329_TR5512_c0_g1~~gnl/Spiro4/10329_TR5512_c0_g1_i1.p1  ORF type:complete len:339 (+),score=40.73 gnl/Spiro4/10329_TR5512_c0_g1_i1:93-1019(+)